jgi:hypothetical protein
MRYALIGLLVLLPTSALAQENFCLTPTPQKASPQTILIAKLRCFAQNLDQSRMAAEAQVAGQTIENARLQQQLLSAREKVSQLETQLRNLPCKASHPEILRGPTRK